ncbi:MAG: hypothetical protein KatS3mg102_2531 [Planctomycetota bacterium]|nr:MAG: hypothetical protein KatS3mg102_2531 [Planctomycetota bacterium]
MDRIELDGLPGSELIEQGLADLAAGRQTVPALLVAIARTRLRRLGLPVAPCAIADPAVALYRLLVHQQPAGAFGRYNALLRRLDSFAHALERRHGQGLRARGRRPEIAGGAIHED